MQVKIFKKATALNAFFNFGKNFINDPVKLLMKYYNDDT